MFPVGVGESSSTGADRSLKAQCAQESTKEKKNCLKTFGVEFQTIEIMRVFKNPITTRISF